MMRQRVSLFRKDRSFLSQTALIYWAFFACLLVPFSALAVNDPSLHDPGQKTQIRQPPPNDRKDPPAPRIPPQEAFQACEGKKEGDPCTFLSPQAMLSGECHAGFENQFACRPHRGGVQPKAVQGAVSDNLAEPRVLSQDESQIPRKTVGQIRQPVDPVLGRNADFFEKLERSGRVLIACIVIALVSAGLTWYGCYRYSTLPLRRLRRVTQQLAGGNLAARVGEGLVVRQDEVANLGRDVDRMAERIESLVGAHQRLIRDVSHELRSPLARLNVALELARQSAGPAHTAPFDRIERESDRLNELIGQLLILTKLESESGMPKRENLDLAGLIGEIAQDVDFEARSNERGVVLTACEPLMLNGNREMLRQALENLIRNAARYTAAGTEVEIALGIKEAQGRGWAHVVIRDKGPGVPESELKNIFRPFYRVNDARERQSGGAGVGLAIADRAVQLHGGSVRAHNAPGGGLSLEMELPMA